MRRDPCTGLYYPYYRICTWVWDKKREEYERYTAYTTQSKNTAIEIVRNMPVNADVPQIDIYEEQFESCEHIAIKESYDGDPSEAFYNPFTNEDL